MTGQKTINVRVPSELKTRIEKVADALATQPGVTANIQTVTLGILQGTFTLEEMEKKLGLMAETSQESS